MYMAAASFSGALDFNDLHGIDGVALDIAIDSQTLVAMTSEKGVFLAEEGRFAMLEGDGLAQILALSPGRSHQWVLTGKGKAAAEHKCQPDKSVPTS